MQGELQDELDGLTKLLAREKNEAPWPIARISKHIDVDGYGGRDLLTDIDGGSLSSKLRPGPVVVHASCTRPVGVRRGTGLSLHKYSFSGKKGHALAVLVHLHLRVSYSSPNQ